MTSGYRLTASTGIHRGDRRYQQDQVRLIEHPRISGCLLAVVADGMGGRSGGRKASDQVVMTAKQLFERYDPKTDDPASTLLKIVQEAHLVIKLTAIASEQEPHSTLAAFLINPDASCHWAHAGDSRIYHYRGNRLMKRTLDHSYVQTLVNRGEITEKEAVVHAQSNILMGCLGTEASPPVGFHFIPQLQLGDALMICSDGLWHYFDADEFGSILSTLTARESTAFLIQKARSRARGGGDNISVVVVKVDSLN